MEHKFRFTVNRRQYHVLNSKTCHCVCFGIVIRYQIGNGLAHHSTFSGRSFVNLLRDEIRLFSLITLFCFR
jgi:hypothetical protein